MPTSGSFPGGVRSETSSDSGEVSTPPSQSPPRSIAPEKATTFAGNKPRPLRLVQDQTERKTSAEIEEGKAKRASWMGWAFGKKEDEGGAAVGGKEESIRE